jgi:hypothetical protein
MTTNVGNYTTTLETQLLNQVGGALPRITVFPGTFAVDVFPWILCPRYARSEIDGQVQQHHHPAQTSHDFCLHLIKVT